MSLVRDQYKKKLIDFLSDPDNCFCTRTVMRKDVLGISGATFYKHFSPQAISDIENEAFEIRKKNSARQRSELMEALHKEGKDGNVAAAKEFLDRTEGKVPIKQEVALDAILEVKVMDNFK